ncbi:HTH-type transcriptional regulator CysB [mine drainage metagenome]|uniref:HTH-type transcriptional regulator CysB n=1 Tax=mine drainage metagenome TaxID=410659 RepID=A0A1J5QUE6_9ZZZZ
MRLDPISLRLFVSVVEEGTIAAAAEHEHLAASAVSKRLSELEETLNTQLLARSNKGIEPTAAGFALLNLARGVLHNLDEIYSQMREYSSGVRGHIRVFANISAITQLLPEKLKSFLAVYPQVQIHLEEKISTVITKAVAENAADIGIFTMGHHGHHLEVFPYHCDELVLIAPEHHILAQKPSVCLAETLDFDYVGLHTGSAINHQLIKSATKLERSLKLRIQVTSYDALCLMVDAGLGIGIIPSNSAKPYLKSLAIKAVALNEPWAKRELAICIRSYDALSVAARVLVDHLKNSTDPCHKPAIAFRDGRLA